MVSARKAAIAIGSPRYFTGRPCVRGHISDRYTKSKVCVDCSNYHRQLPEYREKMRQWSRENFAKNRQDELARSRLKESRPETKKMRADRRAARREELNKRNAAYRAANPETARAAVREHYKRNQQAYRARDRRRRAMLAGCGGSHTQMDIEALRAEQNGLCRYCCADLAHEFHVDHRMPIALGGSNEPRNLQLLCPDCNRSKGAKRPEEFERLIWQK